MVLFICQMKVMKKQPGLTLRTKRIKWKWIRELENADNTTSVESAVHHFFKLLLYTFTSKVVLLQSAL